MKLLLILCAVSGMALSTELKDESTKTDCDIKNSPFAKTAKNQCVKVTCNKKGKNTFYGMVTCGAFMPNVPKGKDNEWKIVTDKSAPYPDCCPRMVPSVTDKKSEKVSLKETKTNETDGTTKTTEIDGTTKTTETTPVKVN